MLFLVAGCSREAKLDFGLPASICSGASLASRSRKWTRSLMLKFSFFKLSMCCLGLIKFFSFGGRCIHTFS